MDGDLNFGGVLGQSVQDGVRIGNLIVNTFSWIFFLLSRPLVLVTQVFFRKELGERYLTGLQVTACLVLIFAAAAITVETSTVTTYQNSYNNWGRVVRTEVTNVTWQTKVAYLLALLWIGGFLSVASRHFQITLRKRRTNGVLWHSRSDGTPRWSLSNIYVELAILIVLAVLLFWGKLYGFGVLVALSFAVTALADHHAKKQLYNRVLDAIDGQIESEWMGKAIEQRLSANDAQGLNASLPAHVSDEYRKKVAKLFKQPALV